MAARLAFAGRVCGVLTAAHVLDGLPDQGELGLVTLAGQERQFRKQTIEMAETTKISIRGNGFGPDGPDLGFLRLPEKYLGWLRAINSFYNLTKSRDEYLANSTPGPDSVDAIVGMIHERTKTLMADNLRKKGFEALFSDGRIVETRHATGHDLLSFLPTAYPDFQLPANFQGTSGGALWRVYIGVKDDVPQVVGKCLWGVPFYQSPPDKNNERTLTCHGPDGIYTSILDEIIRTWPDETKEIQ